VIDASSELGIDGTVEIHYPDVDLASALTALPAAFLDAASLLRERCAARRGGERAGSFAVRSVGGVPAEPDGALIALALPSTAAASETRTSVAFDSPHAGVLLASHTSCD
jgi:large exoprotein involved in heme utilization and adhesion